MNRTQQWPFPGRVTPAGSALSLLRLLLVAAGLLLAAGVARADNQIATLRGTTSLDENGSAPPVARVVNSDIRQVRAYPEQPPVIPHATDGYQIDLNANRCLSCHSRAAVAVSQAPMISVTHYMDREGQFLATVSPRRLFCTQCHVTQTDVQPMVGNDFVDVDRVLDYLKTGSGE